MPLCEIDGGQQDVAKSRSGISAATRGSAGGFSVESFSVGKFRRRPSQRGDQEGYDPRGVKGHHLHPLAGFSLTETVPGVGVDDGGGIAGAGGVCDVHESEGRDRVDVAED